MDGKSMYSKAVRSAVEERLASLVAEMDRGRILYCEALSAFRKAFGCSALREYHGNLSKTAPALGLHRITLTASALICKSA
jgi:DNA-binding NtrC family response regulator